MFSKEWFIYIFGRWIALSGIAGALAQFVLSDKLGIPTIPAFLINQLILGCVFWYVDKYIFRKHFGVIKDMFRFPRVKGVFDLNFQINKISNDAKQLYDSFVLGKDWLHQFVDLYHVMDMTERIIREKGFDFDGEYDIIVGQNKKKGLYGS